MKKPEVGILMGSSSDLEVMQEAGKILEQFQIPYETVISSAHRSPKRTTEYAESAEGRGLKVLIAGAGGAAHLAGVLAAHTTLPVIGVPIDSSPLKGLDSILATAQMPGGVPVATMAIGRAGAQNAALHCVSILALSDKRLSDELKRYRQKLAEDVVAKDRQLRNP